MVTKKDVSDYASVAGGVAKTFLKGTAGSGSEKDIDYGPGPTPKAPTPKAPDDIYKSYGAYSPRGQGSKRTKKRPTKR